MLGSSIIAELFFVNFSLLLPVMKLKIFFFDQIIKNFEMTVAKYTMFMCVSYLSKTHDRDIHIFYFSIFPSTLKYICTLTVYVSNIKNW